MKTHTVVLAPTPRTPEPKRLFDRESLQRDRQQAVPEGDSFASLLNRSNQRPEPAAKRTVFQSVVLDQSKTTTAPEPSNQSVFLARTLRKA